MSPDKTDGTDQTKEIEALYFEQQTALQENIDRVHEAILIAQLFQNIADQQPVDEAILLGARTYTMARQYSELPRVDVRSSRFFEMKKPYKLKTSMYMSPRVHMDYANHIYTPGDDTGDFGMHMTDRTSGINLTLLLDGVTDLQHPESDKKLSRLCELILPRYQKDFFQKLLISHEPQYMLDNVKSLAMHDLHNILQDAAYALDIPMKATGIMCVETRDHIFAVRWGDCGWAYLVDGENGPIAHILKPNNTKTLDSPTIGTTQAAHDLTLTDHEREIESASARIIITKSYNDGGKFNRPDGAGVGVIGYKGDFDKYIEAFGVEKPKKGIFTHCSWTDGFVLLCHLCGITQPWVAAAVLHQFSFGEGKKLSYTPTQILVLYALNKMSQGWVPDDHEYRNKFDDMSLVVSSRNPNIFDLPDTTGEIGNLRTLIQDYPYLAKEAERRIQQITLKKNS